MTYLSLTQISLKLQKHVKENHMICPAILIIISNTIIGTELKEIIKLTIYFHEKGIFTKVLTVGRDIFF